MSASHSKTSPTLLGRIRDNPADQEAWSRFVERYGPRIYKWCRHWQLQQADAEDVTQAVLLKLAEKMREFVYDPGQSFRAWLKTVTHHALCDFVNCRSHRNRAQSVQESNFWDQIEAQDDLAARLEREYDIELLDQAKELVRQQVAPHWWQAYELVTVAGLSGAEVAARLGIKVATVFTIKAKMHKRLQAAMRRLEGVADE